MSDAPLILWFRRDLRLSDHPMLTEAVTSGRPLIPVFILDPETEAIGAAARWRLGLSLADFAGRLADLGSRLVLRRLVEGNIVVPFDGWLQWCGVRGARRGIAAGTHGTPAPSR